MRGSQRTRRFFHLNLCLLALWYHTHHRRSNIHSTHRDMGNAQSNGKVHEDHGILVPDHQTELDDTDPDLSLQAVQSTAIKAIEQGSISVS